MLHNIQMVESKFEELLDHSFDVLKKKWLYGILDDFVTKQLPHNVTWGLSLLYALEHSGDRSLTSTQGEILIWYIFWGTANILSLSLSSILMYVFRWAGTCFEVLSICGIPKLFSFWWHSWVASEVPWTLWWYQSDIWAWRTAICCPVGYIAHCCIIFEDRT